MIDIGDPLWTQLQLVESPGPDGIVNIALVGELDLSVVHQFSSHLDQLRRGGVRVRLDLSELEFTDVSGVRALMRAAQYRCESGEQLLEIDHAITPAVRRVLDLVGAGPTLWPTTS
jgi:anti-anti-sigma factor